MAMTTDCAEGRHEVCRGAGPNHYCPQTAHLGDQKCACRCHDARSPQGEDHKAGHWECLTDHSGEHDSTCIYVSPSPERDTEKLRAAAKRVLEADMRGVRDLDALVALEDAAGLTQQGQRQRDTS